MQGMHFSCRSEAAAAGGGARSGGQEIDEFRKCQSSTQVRSVWCTLSYNIFIDKIVEGRKFSM
jgi:hypothetical protein